MSDYLFVYGTLRQTSNNPKAAALHARAKLIGEGWVMGHLYKISWYPALKLDKHGQEVYGDVYQLEEPVKTELLNDMDAYEGIEGGQPDMSEYSRVLVKVHTPEGSLKCWTYQYNWKIPEDAELIASGDFLNP